MIYSVFLIKIQGTFEREVTRNEFIAFHHQVSEFVSSQRQLEGMGEDSTTPPRSAPPCSLLH